MNNKTDEELSNSNEWSTNLYNIRGYLNKSVIYRTSLLIYFALAIPTSYFIQELKYILYDGVLDFKDMLNPNFQKFYFDIYKNWIEENVMNGVNIEFIVNLIVSSLLPLFLIYNFIKKTTFLAEIQANLASLNLNQYYLHSYDNEARRYTFKLIKGAKINYKGFIDKTDDLKQLFNVGKLKASRNENNKIILEFSEVMPDKDNVPKMDYKKLTGAGRLFLGISDINGTPVYGTAKEQGDGLINGNMLIVGGSGSGKSFMLKEMIQNFLLPENYQFIDKIYVINYKASADYNFLQGLNKFEYADDIPSGLRILKKVQLDMMTKYKYNSVHSEDNFTAYQTILILDEVQNLNETLESKSLHKIMKATVQESLSILEMLGSKIRASNGTLINVLQKADVSSLPSTAYRSNLRNRIMLKQENVSSAHLVVNSDITEKNSVNPLELKQGQYLYWDMLTNQLQEGFVILTGNEANAKILNELPMNSHVQKVLNEVHSYKNVAIEAVSIFKNILEKLEADGKKTFYDTFEDVEQNEIEDIFSLAEKSLAEKNEDTPEKDGQATINKVVKDSDMELFQSI